MNFNPTVSSKVIVAASGGGRSLENLILKGPKLGFKVLAVILSRFDCGAYGVAKKYELPVFCADFSKLEPYLVKDLENWLQFYEADLVVLAGFLKKFPIFDAWQRKVINIHPALLPRFGGKGMHGKKVHEAVLISGEKVSGATVHYVDGNYDTGEIISQESLKIDLKWTADDLSAAVFELEKDLLPKTVAEVLKRARMKGNERK